jgi:hypothetical protein
MVTISRVYKDYDTATRVLTELERSGVQHSDVSIVANNESGWFDRDTSNRVDRDHDGRDDRAEGAATGAGIGATLGGVAGLLAGLGMLAIPGIGPVVAAGWLVSTGAMAAAGGATGGLIGALTQSGVGENEADAYAEGVRSGGTLVSVKVPDADRPRFEAIMDRYSPMSTSSMGTMTTGAAGTTSPSSVGTEHQATNLSGDRIVAVFDNKEKACIAREALVAAGIDNASMELLANRSDLDNWSALKRHAVPDEDTHLYAEGLGRGHSILVIRAAASEHDRVMQVLSRSTPIDIDDHANRWRQAGWSGVHTGKAVWDVQRVSPAATTGNTRPAATPPARTGTETNEQVIPVYEEELKVGKAGGRAGPRAGAGLYGGAPCAGRRRPA